jgi:glycosyltransferase involved in cell wall biosynthesis
MQKRKKVALFSGYFPPHTGGVERYVDKLSVELSKLGYEVIIITSNDAKVDSITKKSNYKIYRLPIRNLFRTRYPIPHKNKEYRKLIKQIEMEEADCYIVNTRFHLTSLIGAKMGHKQGKPVFLIEHGTDHFTVNNKILDFGGHI